MSHLAPHTGDSSSIIDRLLEYIAPFDPDFSERICGAPLDMISIYSKFAGFGGCMGDLPIAYAAFLRSMGSVDGGLLKNLRIQARLQSLIDLYEDCLRSEPETLNPNLPIIATYIIGEQISFDRSTNFSDPEVVESADGEFVSGFSKSWEYLLMQAAILQVEPRRLPFGRWFSSSQKSAARSLPPDDKGKQSASATVDLMANEFGLDIAWVSDKKHRIALSEDTSLFSTIGIRNEIVICAFSRDESRLSKIGDVALSTLGAGGGIL